VAFKADAALSLSNTGSDRSVELTELCTTLMTACVIVIPFLSKMQEDEIINLNKVKDYVYHVHVSENDYIIKCVIRVILAKFF